MCQYLNVSKSECVKIWMCQNLNVSKSECVKIWMSELIKVTHSPMIYIFFLTIFGHKFYMMSSLKFLHFQIRHFPIFINSHTFRFWHFQILTHSHSETFRVGPKLDSDTFKFWHIHVSRKERRSGSIQGTILHFGNWRILWI